MYVRLQTKISEFAQKAEKQVLSGEVLFGQAGELGFSTATQHHHWCHEEYGISALMRKKGRLLTDFHTC